MPVVGITGSIASGKSTVAVWLVEALGAEFFDADRSVRELTRHLETQAAIRREFGPQVFDSKGLLDRSALRAIVFSDPERRRALEAILHPAVRAQWMGRAETARREGRWFLADIPLLFETGAAEHFDATVAVGCSRGTQLRRLTQNRGLETQAALQMMAAQLDMSAKLAKADHVIWNDSTIENARAQSEMLSKLLTFKYG